MILGMEKTMYTRALASSERVYLAIKDRYRQVCIEILLTGHGNLSLAQLQQAIATASAANPGSRLRLHGHLRASVWRDSGIAPPSQQLTFEQVFASDTPAHALPRLADSFKQGRAKLDVRHQSCVEVILIEGQPCRILFRVFHGVMDGGGVFHWIKDVFRALRQEVPLGSNNAQTDYQLAKSFAVNTARADYPSDRMPPFDGSAKNSSNQPVPMAHRDDEFVSQQISIPGKFPGLVARLAVILAQRCHQQGDQQPRFFVATDLRRRQAQLHSTANLSSPIFVVVQPGLSWQQVYQNMLIQLQEKQDCQVGKFDPVPQFVPCSLLNLGLQYFIRRQLRRRRFQYSALISNLGPVPAEQLSCADFALESCTSLPLDNPIVPLTIITVENEDAVNLSLSMPRTLADASEAKQIAEYLAQALLASNPESELQGAVQHTNPPLDPALFQQLVYQLNAAKLDYPKQASVVALFEQQVQRIPQAIAVSHGSQELSYAALDARANQLARRLLSCEQSSVVGVLAERSIGLVIALLAILKTGAAYLPIDPGYPLERRKFMLAHAQARIVLASGQYLANNQIEFDGTVLNLDDENSFAADSSRPPCTPQAHDLAYVIYTSGSTGNPKGVEIEHQQLLNYVCWAKHSYHPQEALNYPLFTSPAFDLTITSLFVPLMSGAQIIVFDDPSAQQMLLQVVHDPRIAILKATPTHLRLLNALDIGPSSLRKMIVGGENLATPLAAALTTKFAGKLEIYNEYGPTETTVGCMIHRYDSTQDLAAAVPIGRAAENSRIYILDQDLQPVPPGVEGEIYIAGIGLGRGYRNNPAQTAAAFLSDPFFPAQRMYRSGDLARWNTRLEIEYAGRIADQVKIRGHRIELAEVEAALQACTQLKQSALVVSADPNNPEQQCLCAYVVAEQTITASQIRAELAKTLPNAMLPGYILQVAALPLTTNGKLDTRALPAPTSSFSQKDHLALQSEMQLHAPRAAQLRAIWAQCMAIPFAAVDEHASFFDLGGDSIKLSELLLQLSKAFLPANRQNALFAQVGRFLQEPNLAQIDKILVELERELIPKN